MTTSQNTNFQSTSDEDPRITKVGKIIRRYKIDEFVQFYNVLFGNISIVGPRPNVQDDVVKYTSLERKILSVKPGITDFSSIVFSDEGSILKNSENPDLDYNKFIRPWKSRLAILYIENMSITIDIKLIFLTFYNLINRKKTLIYLNSILREITSDQELLKISLRESELYEKNHQNNTSIKFFNYPDVFKNKSEQFKKIFNRICSEGQFILGPDLIKFEKIFLATQELSTLLELEMPPMD